MRRLAAVCGVAVPLVGAADLARAADEKVACVAAADAGQQQRSAGKLLLARTSFQICSREVCPGIVRADCTRWREEVQASVPTVVLRAQDPRGQDLSDVKVALDGTPIADKIDGLPIEIDPGQHVLTGEHAGSKKLRQDIVIRTGDRNRTISLVLEDVEPLLPVVVPPPAPEPRRISPAAWAFSGVAVVAAASGTYFGLRALNERNNLRSCGKECPEGSLDSVRTKINIADASFGVAILSAGVATYFFLTPSKPRATTLPAHEVLVTPMLGGGAAASWIERF
jgi:hypothetical protein